MIARFDKLEADVVAVKGQLENTLLRLDKLEQLLQAQQEQLTQMAKLLELRDQEIKIKDKQIAELRADNERLYDKVKADQKWETWKMVGMAAVTVLSIVLLKNAAIF